MSLTYHVHVGPFFAVSREPGPRTPDLGAMQDRLKDALAPSPLSYNGKDVWLPNHSRGQPRQFGFSAATYLCIQPDHNMIQSEREWFQAAFAVEWKMLREAYGEYNVHVCWGVVSVAW